MAQEYAVTVCESSEVAATNLAATPHYLAVTANSMIDESMTNIVQGMISTLDLIVTGVEALIIFYIEFLVGTYACLLVSLIDGVVDVAVNATESVIDFTNTHLEAISQDLQAGVNALSDLFTKIEAFVYDIGWFFSGEKSAMTTVNISINALKDLKIPSSVNEKLTEIRDKTPTYDEVKNSTINIIQKPFDMIKTELKKASGNIYFNKSMLSVPDKHKDIQFCSKPEINEIFDRVRSILQTGCVVLVVLSCVCAAAVCIWIMYLEVCRWRWQCECAKVFTGSLYSQERVLHCASSSDPDIMAAENVRKSHCNEDEIYRNQKPECQSAQVQVMAAITMSDSHWRVRIQNLVCKVMLKEPDWQMSCKWYVDWILQKRPLAMLGLGLLGLVSAGVQKAILTRAMHEAPALAEAARNGMRQVAASVNDDVNLWVDSANSAINLTQHSLNKDLLGWVSIGTESVNATLSHFLETMNSDLKSSFGGTPLYKPISTVVGCVIGNKIEQVIKGLTWVHDHAHVNLPLVRRDTLLNGFDEQFFGNANESSLSNTTLYGGNSTATPDITSGIRGGVVSYSSTLESRVLRSVDKRIQLGTSYLRQDRPVLESNCTLPTQDGNVTSTSYVSNGTNSFVKPSTSAESWNKGIEFLNKSVGKYVSVLNTEMVISAILVFLWVALAMAGLVYCIYTSKFPNGWRYRTHTGHVMKHARSSICSEQSIPNYYSLNNELVAKGSVKRFPSRPPPLRLRKTNLVPELESDWNFNSYPPGTSIFTSGETTRGGTEQGKEDRTQQDRLQGQGYRRTPILASPHEIKQLAIPYSHRLQPFVLRKSSAGSVCL